MILTKKHYYILRIGDFATNANTKIYYSVFTSLLCVDDYITNHSNDCFNIMLYSTFIWTVIEFLLHMSNTRIIKPMFFYFFNHKYKLPFLFGIFLQGFQEGGCVTTIGLYFGDRLYNYKSVVFLHFLILFIIGNVSIKHRINNFASKRLVNSNGSVSLMSIITLFNFNTLYQHPPHFYRQMKMLFIMIYVCSFWTFTTWYKGFRKVEVYIKNEQDIEVIQMQSGYDTFYILGYDVAFEIGMAYLFFYNILIT